MRWLCELRALWEDLPDVLYRMSDERDNPTLAARRAAIIHGMRIAGATTGTSSRYIALRIRA